MKSLIFLKRERSNRTLATFVESTSISLILAASRAGIRIPLVTDSTRLRNAFQSCIVPFEPQTSGLLNPTFATLVLISLDEATTDDLESSAR